MEKKIQIIQSLNNLSDTISLSDIYFTSACLSFGITLAGIKPVENGKIDFILNDKTKVLELQNLYQQDQLKISARLFVNYQKFLKSLIYQNRGFNGEKII